MFSRVLKFCFSPPPPTGISSETILKPSDISEEELLDLIDKLNTDHRVDGLLVQLPLPGMQKKMEGAFFRYCDCPPVAQSETFLCFLADHIDERMICNAVSPTKDVDGFHVVNVGRMCLDQSTMLPATPWGVWEIIKRTGDNSSSSSACRALTNHLNEPHIRPNQANKTNRLDTPLSGIPTLGKNVVVAGRSKNVGMPIAMLLHTDGRHERPGGGSVWLSVCLLRQETLNKSSLN